MYDYDQRERSFPHFAVGLVRPDQFSLTDAKSVAVIFASGSRRSVSAKAMRARLPDIDISNVVIAPRRTFLERVQAAYRAFVADIEPRIMPHGPADAGGNIVPFRQPA